MNFMIAFSYLTDFQELNRNFNRIEFAKKAIGLIGW